MSTYVGTKRTPKFYTPHDGTLRISGSTVPGKAAGRAMSLLKQNGIEKIDFFLIGGNANQQAMKAMSLFKIFLEDDTKGTITLSFAPIHVRTMAKAPAGAEMVMDATVWRTIILTSEQSQIVNE